MKKVILKIDGMHCDGCSNRLEKVLKKQENIKDAKVSFKTKEAIIEYDKMDLKEIEKIIEDTGFKSLGE